eukprot:3787669-Ditylum_brightwellii.AAC.1
MENIQQNPFLVATDGSSGMNSMLSGWKITTKTGDLLAIHTGPVFGQSSSFCLEAYGVLLVMCFLFWAAQYTNTTAKLSFKLYLDNESVITRIHQQQSYPYNYLFHTLDPDWDAIAQIVSILNKSNLHTELRHVKDNQD